MIYQLDDLDLSKCAFLIGNSTDPQPLLRLRQLLTPTYATDHLSTVPDVPIRQRPYEVEAQTFVSATVGKPTGHHANADDFLRDFGLKLEELNRRERHLSIKGTPVKFTLPKLDIGHQLLPSGIFEKAAWDRYEAMFGADSSVRTWGVDILLHRHLGNSMYPVRLIHIAAEGLKTLWMLSKMGLDAPRIIMTVQTGVLERAGSPLEKLLDHFQVRPALWVRGYWAQLFWNQIYPTWSGEARAQEGGAYNVEVQHYSHWNGSLRVKEDMSAVEWRNANVSLVRAFAERHLGNSLLQKKTISSSRDRTVNLINEALDPSDDGRTKIVTNRIRNKWKASGFDVRHVATWEDFGLDHGDSLSRALNVVEAGPHRRKHYAIVPIGFEDQGALFESFSWERTGLVTVDVYFTDELDYADMRGWNDMHSARRRATSMDSQLP